MTELLDVLWYTTVLLLVLASVFAVLWWLEIRRNDRADEALAAVAAERDTARKERDQARYDLGRLERKLARVERLDATRVQRTAYVDMPTRVNGERVR